jgi:type I restriction enzyme R subunit
MAIGSERGAVQNPFIRYAVEAGWTYLSPDDALRLRPGPTSPVLMPVLVQQLQKLNPGTVDQRRAEDVANPCNIYLAALRFIAGRRDFAP